MTTFPDVLFKPDQWCLARDAHVRACEASTDSGGQR